MTELGGTQLGKSSILNREILQLESLHKVTDLQSRRKYTEPMKTKPAVSMPGVEYLIDGRGLRTAFVIRLKKHRTMWEDMLDAYLAETRRSEPRESLAAVKRLV